MSSSAAAIDQSNSSEPAWSDRIGIPALVTATTISNLGNGITSLAIPWFVLVTTGSPARTGIAGALVVLANVLSSTLGGAVVDRLGFKRASIFSDLLSGVTVAIIPTLHLLGLLEYWHLLILIFAGAVFDAPGSVARTALIPRLARQAGMPLERANSAMQFADQSSRALLGPLIAGLLIGFVGAASVLFIDAATFAVSIIVVGLLVRVPARPAAASVSEGGEGASQPAQRESFLGSIRAGFEYALRDEFLRLVIPVSLIYNFILSPTVAVILPVLARNDFGSAGALGLMIAAFGAGSAVGTIAYGWRGHRVSRSRIFLIAVAAISLGFWILPFASNVWLGMLGMVIIGLSIGPTNAMGMTIMQTRVPEEMLGRVFGFMFSSSMAVAPLGVFLAGILIETVGLFAVMVMAAVGVTIAMLRVFTVRSVVRQFDDQQAPTDDKIAGG
ncbi:MFS transporter [soil metagenome]